MIFCIFYQVNLTGSGAFQIGLVQKTVITFIKSAKKSFFIIEKIQKYRKCPALGTRARIELEAVLEKLTPRGTGFVSSSLTHRQFIEKLRL